MTTYGIYTIVIIVSSHSRCVSIHFAKGICVIVCAPNIGPGIVIQRDLAKHESTGLAKATIGVYATPGKVFGLRAGPEPTVPSLVSEVGQTDEKVIIA